MERRSSGTVPTKQTPKVVLRTSSRIQRKSLKSKTQAQTSGRKRQQDQRPESESGFPKRTKKTVSDHKNGKTNKKKETKIKPMPRKKRMTKAEIVVDDDNIIHIMTGVVEANDDTNETDGKMKSTETQPKTQQSKAAKRKSNHIKLVNAVKKEPSTAENSIPSIEDELKLIEGEHKGIKAKRRNRKRKQTQKPKVPPTKHCNLCTESFYSELDLAYHCKELHFKTKFILKDGGTEEVINGNGGIVASSDENVAVEHQYFKDVDLVADQNSTEKCTELGDKSEGKDRKPTADLATIETVVYVRKVRQEDRKYCNFCKRMFLSNKGLKDHIEMRCKLVPYRCFCGKGLKEPNELHTHYPNLKIPKYKPGNARIECPNCHQRFSFRETFQNHKLTCTEDLYSGAGKIVKQQNSEENDETKTIICSECDKVFADTKALKQHKTCEHKKHDTVCDICGKYFASRGGLKTHKEIHSDRKPYMCEHCGTGFNQKGNLMQHLKTDIGPCRGDKGENTLMIECSLCGRSFTSLNRLKQHEQKHERMAQDELHCQHCGKDFNSVHQLKRHQMIHTGERPHTCRFCEKSFAQKSNMMAHMRIHTGYRPYECYICGQGFTQGTTLKMHVSQNHDIRNYKFKKMPRGRRYKDSTEADDQVVDIEQKYIERALKDSKYLNTSTRVGKKPKRAEKGYTDNNKTKEIGTQADDDEADIYYDYDYDEDVDNDDNGAIDYSTKGKEVKSEAREHKDSEMRVKEVDGQRVYFQVVGKDGDAANAPHISVDTSVLTEVIKRSLNEPGLHPALDEALQRVGYIQQSNLPQTVREIDRSTKVGGKMQQAMISTTLTRELDEDSEDAMRKLSEEAVKRSLYESRKFVQPSSEPLKSFLYQQAHAINQSVIVLDGNDNGNESDLHKTVSESDTHVKTNASIVNSITKNTSVDSTNKDTGSIQLVHSVEDSGSLHVVETVIGDKGEHIVIMEPRINRHVHNEKNSTTLNNQVNLETVIPMMESEAKKAVIGLQNDQRNVESNETYLQTYQVEASEYNHVKEGKNSETDSQGIIERYESVDEPGVEYVTVIFEDDGTQSIEEEIDLINAAVSSRTHAITTSETFVPSRQDLNYSNNVSDLIDAAVIEVGTGRQGQQGKEVTGRRVQQGKEVV